MDVLELDLRLERDINNFEKNLLKYDDLLEKVNNLKESYIKQSTELAESYKKKADSIMKGYSSDIAKIELIISEIEANKKNSYEISQEIEQKNIELDNSLQEVHERYENKWKSFDEKITNKIKILKDENKKELLKIVNALSINEKEIVNSNTNVTSFISDEVYKLSSDITNINETVVLVDKRLSTFKESTAAIIAKINKDSSLSNKSLDSKFQELHMGLEQKYNKLNKRMYYLLGTIALMTVILILFR